MSHPYPTARTRSILVLFFIALLFAVPFSGEFVEDPVRAAQASPSDEFASAQPVRASASNAACQLTWRVVPSPNVGALYAVTAISANDVWAGGDGDFLHWDGNAWNVVPKPSAGAIWGMSAVSTNVWAVGYFYDSTTSMYQSVILRWDGTQWNVIPAPVHHYSDVTAISPNDVWVVGDSILHWDGTQWNTFSIPEPDDYLYAVDAAAADDVWAVGRGRPSRIGNHVLAMHWDGNTWNVVGVVGPGISAYLADVAVLSATDAWAVGSISGLSLIVRWDGSRWNLFSPPGLPSGDLWGIAAPSANNAWAVGTPYGIVHWDGTAWSIVPTLNPPGPNQLWGVAAVSANDVWAVGYSYPNGQRQTLILHGELPCVTPTPTPTPTPTLTPTPPPCSRIPRLLAPVNGAVVTQPQVILDWSDVHCASRYEVIVRRRSVAGEIVDDKSNLTSSRYQTVPLSPFRVYFWRVRACNSTGCSRWSDWWRFAVLPP